MSWFKNIFKKEEKESLDKGLEKSSQGFFDKIYINRYNFTESFDNPKSKSEIKSCSFTSIYEVLNELYAKINIDPISQELIDEDYPIDFIHIQFYSDLIGVNSTSKNILQNFIRGEFYGANQRRALQQTHSRSGNNSKGY